MKVIWVTYLMVSLCAFTQAEIDGGKFKQDYYFYQRNPTHQPSWESVQRHRDSVFVFVTGFLGEYPPSAWKESIHEIDSIFDNSIRKKNTFLIRPSSGNTVTENAVFLRSEIDKILDQVGPNKKIMLVGHSKGAYEAWTMLMPEPLFVKEHLAGAIFLQGPFLGSHIANHIMEGKSVGDIEPFTSDPVAWGTRWLLSQRAKMGNVRRGMVSITSAHAQAHTKEIQQVFGPNFDEEAHSRTLFITTSMHPDDAANAPFIGLESTMATCVRTLQKITKGPNDGVIKTDHQYPLNADRRMIRLMETHHQTIVKTDAGAAFAKALLGIIP